jgi:peptidoglycan hydrolase-like protein with peptidoglycan-binding domain
VSWIVAESLERLRQQLNALAPNRSKASDGGIGDAAHASRNSDHDPWYGPGIVTARDFTNDPAGGLDCFRLRDALIRSKDSRIKYIIFNRQIISGNGGPQPWVARRYEGVNPHTKHLHLSVVADKRCRDGSPWMLPGITSPVTPAKYPTLQRGSSGPAVGVIQRFLGVTPVSEFFGPATESAVKAYQKMRGLTADGVVGPATWRETGL